MLMSSLTSGFGQQKVNFQTACHPEDVKHYDTKTLRERFVMEKVMVADEINLTYSHYDRFIFGGAMPVNKTLNSISPVNCGCVVKLQPVSKLDFHIECSVQLVTLVPVLVITVGPQGVTGAEELTLDTGISVIHIGIHTIIIHLMTVLVCGDYRISVGIQCADIQGIDGGHHTGVIHQ